MADSPSKSAKKNGRTGTATRAQAQKAIAELNDKPRSAEFRGLKLTLPAQMPATFVFDIAEMQAGDGTDFGVMHRLMVGFLGAEQWRQVRDKIGEDKVGFDQLLDVTEELFEAITGAYGASLGESSASVES